MTKEKTLKQLQTEKAANAREAALLTLLRVTQEGAYANLALNQVLRKAQLSPADQRLATELSYGTLRMQAALDFQLAQLLRESLTETAPVLLQILRLGVYQLQYMSKIPVAAAVNEAVKLAKQYGGSKGASGLVNAVLRNYGRQRIAETLPGPEDPAAYCSITLSHPRWLVDYLLKRWPAEEVVAYCAFNNQVQGLSLRVNTLKLQPQLALDLLQDAGVEAHPGLYAPESIHLSKSGGLEQLPSFRQGGLLAQGEASQLVAHALHPEPGMKVLDLCAAPGGKATHLAALMENQGVVHAVDFYPHKMKLIEDNCRRLGVDILETHTADARQLPEQYQNYADAVLVDAPCSGLGVLNQRADSRWRKKAADIEELAALGYQLLEAAAGYLKPGGRLCFSTCTITEEENQDNLARFLAAHREFELLPLAHLQPLFPENEQAALARGYFQILPQRHQLEGFFIALLGKRA